MNPGTVLLIGECHEGALLPVTAELVAAGRAIEPERLILGLFGSGIGEAASAAAALGVDEVLVVDQAEMAPFSTGPATAAAAAMVEACGAHGVIIAGTTSGRDYAPRLAARLGGVSYPDIVELATGESGVIATRPVYGGKAVTNVPVNSGFAILTTRPGAFSKAAADNAPASITQVGVTVDPSDLRVEVLGYGEESGAGSVKLEEAKTIVSGGRGLKEPENFALIEQLATALGGVVGASRAVVDAGWRDHHEQVGQTGRTVSPSLYVAVGISGAVQHVVGMQGSDTIVAINRDPDAPIFRIASFGIVGDLFDVVPALIAELNAST